MRDCAWSWRSSRIHAMQSRASKLVRQARRTAARRSGIRSARRAHRAAGAGRAAPKRGRQNSQPDTGATTGRGTPRFLSPGVARLMTVGARDCTTLTRPFPRADIVRMATLLPGPFTVEMYHKLGELGIFDEDDRVELLDGQIVEMSPIGAAHAACVYRLTNLLARRTSGDVGVSVQNPVLLDPRWEPQPDIALLRRSGGFHGEWVATARDVALVIEVADSSLERDRDVKIPHYALTGIAEAWLIDLEGDAITCYRTPGRDGYEEIVTVNRGATLRPVALPELTIGADEILG